LEKKNLIIKNIFDSLLLVKKKLGNDFDYNGIEVDIFKLLSSTKDYYEFFDK
jgi:hypothetical protein